MEVNLFSFYVIGFVFFFFFTMTRSSESNPMALFSFTANGIRMIPSDKTCQSPMASFFLPSFVLILDLHLFPIHGLLLMILCC